MTETDKKVLHGLWWKDRIKHLLGDVTRQNTFDDLPNEDADCDDRIKSHQPHSYHQSKYLIEDEPGPSPTTNRGKANENLISPNFAINDDE